MATMPSTQLTAEEFAGQYMDVPGYELVRGRVVRLMPGGWDHSYVEFNAGGILRNWAVRTKRGRVLGGELGIITRRKPDSVRGADVAYFSYKRLPRGKEPRGFVETPPELVIEVVGIDRGWRVCLDKASEYLRMGVDRVWILDPGKQSLHVLSGDGPPQQYTARNTIRDAAILRGFSCRVGEFFKQ